MAAVSSPSSTGPFALTKGKIALLVSLAITWWLASLMPHYQPIIKAHFKSRIDEARQQIPTIKLDWNPTDDPRAAYNGSKMAMIVEPRIVPHLVPQILHMITVVPPDWRFIFIGSEKSVAMVGRSAATKHQQIIGKLDLLVMPEPWDISSKELVHRMMTDIRFYDEFIPGVEWLLKYEHDSILCANSESSLNSWLDWSWAGAPKSPDDRFAGNGGLSLRRVSAIRRILGFQARYNDTEPEDEWFGKRVWVLPGAKVAQGTEGALAVEDVYMEKPMGYHIRDGGESLNEDVWKTAEQRAKIFAYCPELSLIMDMKLERERCPGDNRQGTEHPTSAEKEAAKKKQLEAQAVRKAAQEARLKKLQEDRERAKQEVAAKKAAAAAAAASPTTSESPADSTTTLQATPTPQEAVDSPDNMRQQEQQQQQGENNEKGTTDKEANS